MNPVTKIDLLHAAIVVVIVVCSTILVASSNSIPGFFEVVALVSLGVSGGSALVRQIATATATPTTVNNTYAAAPSLPASAPKPVTPAVSQQHDVVVATRTPATTG